ncbi:MAG: response regulator [Gemmatimonadales bacterium]|nr:response regulator [Gemmatimonadales bacterium]
MDTVQQPGDALLIRGPEGQEGSVLDSTDRFYRSLVEQMLEGAALLSPAGGILYANPQLADLVQVKADELLGLLMRDFVCSSDLLSFDRFLGSALGGRAKEEVSLMARDGSLSPVYISGSTLGADGANGICLIVTDLTLQKRNEQLAADERLARSVLEHVTEAVVVCDAEGRIIRMSEEASRLTLAGVGAWFSDAYPLRLSSTEIRSAQRIVGYASSGGQLRGLDAALEDPQGRSRSVVVAAGPLWGVGQRVIGCIVVLTDFTEHRRIQEGLRLAQRLESIGRLAGGMAHEINNQMAVVLGFAEFALKQAGLPSQATQDITHIHRAAERAATVTRQLLAFSRRQLLQPSVVGINAMVGEFEPVIRRVMPDHIELVTALVASPDLVRVDVSQFEQVMLNLALNAFDAMPSRGTLTIETSRETMGEQQQRPGALILMLPGPYLRLAFSDTGTGIPGDVMEHIFEPFFTTKAVGKGTGLGLSTAYGIVKQSSGYIWVSSADGEGTTFEILLPAVGAETAPAGAAVSGAAAGRGEAVLVVEDEPLVRELAARTLRESGYVVYEAMDGLQALEKLPAIQPIQLVVCDLAMPRMNGPQLIIRMKETHPTVPVLLISGLPDQAGLRAECVEGQAVLLKPFPPGALVQAVRELLDGAPP